MKKRIVSLLLALVMVLSLVPTTVWAAEDHDGQVRVIVENTTYAKADGAAWDGTLVDKWVDLVPGSSMMDCIGLHRLRPGELFPDRGRVRLHHRDQRPDRR